MRSSTWTAWSAASSRRASPSSSRSPRKREVRSARRLLLCPLRERAHQLLLRLLLSLRHLHHAGPPLGEIAASVDVVFAHEGEFAVIADPEHRERGRNDVHLVALA